MKKFLILGSTIFVISCAQNTQSGISVATASCPCDIIYGHNDDWNKISDDLARSIYRHNLMCEEMQEK